VALLLCRGCSTVGWFTFVTPIRGARFKVCWYLRSCRTIPKGIVIPREAACLNFIYIYIYIYIYISVLQTKGRIFLLSVRLLPDGSLYFVSLAAKRGAVYLCILGCKMNTVRCYRHMYRLLMFNCPGTALTDNKLQRQGMSATFRSRMFCLPGCKPQSLDAHNCTWASVWICGWPCIIV
jgi:hypothetical protein